MEFIVAGAPRSANANPRSRRRWRERVSRAARKRMEIEGGPTNQDVAVLIIYFYQGETSLDVDNIAKSLLDGLKGDAEGLVHAQTERVLMSRADLVVELSLPDEAARG